MSRLSAVSCMSLLVLQVGQSARDIRNPGTWAKGEVSVAAQLGCLQIMKANAGAAQPDIALTVRDNFLHAAGGLATWHFA